MARRFSICSLACQTLLALTTSSVFAAGPWRRPYGPMVRGLRGGYATYRYGGRPWFFSGGYWYRPWGVGYRAFYPPIGFRLSLLPAGYVSFWFGGIPYYSYEGVYYIDAPSGGYQVAEPPPGRESATLPAEPPAESPDEAALDALLIIPKEGQSEEKMIADRQEAQRYARMKSQYDPAHSDPGDPGTPRARQAYLKAMRSYLEERGYSVK